MDKHDAPLDLRRFAGVCKFHLQHLGVLDGEEMLPLNASKGETLMLASIFAQADYYFEKIDSAIFEPSDNHIAIAKVGISSLLEAVDLFQSSLEDRNLSEINTEWQLDLEDLKYALQHLESAFSAKIQLSTQHKRITLYSIRYLLDRITSLAKSIDRDS